MIYHNSFTYQASVDIDFVAVVGIVEVDTGAAVDMDMVALSGRAVQVVAGIPVVLVADKAVVAFVGSAVAVFVGKAVVALAGKSVEVADEAVVAAGTVAVAGTAGGTVVSGRTEQALVGVDLGELADHSVEQHIIMTINKPFELRSCDLISLKIKVVMF